MVPSSVFFRAGHSPIAEPLGREYVPQKYIINVSIGDINRANVPQRYIRDIKAGKFPERDTNDS